MTLPPMKIPRMQTLGIGAGAVVAVLLALSFNNDAPAAVATQAQAAQTSLLLVPADIVSVDNGGIAQGIRVTGTLEPLDRSTLNARVNAVVDSVPVREGEQVRQGQVLARQNAADLTAQLQQAEAQLSSAETELKLVEAYEVRKKELHAQKYLSDVDWAAAQGETELRRATLKLRQAGLAMARKALADATVTAPFDGIVTTRHVEPGSNVMVGQALLTLVDLSVLELAADIPARDINQVRIGSDVRFSVDGQPGRQFRGKVVRINPMTNGGSRTLTVYARVDNRDGTLKGGMFASGQVVRENTGKALRIPVGSVRRIDNREQVWVIRDNKLALQPVTLGLRDGSSGLVEVREGLAAGEQVILTDIGARSAGMPVSVAVTP